MLLMWVCIEGRTSCVKIVYIMMIILTAILMPLISDFGNVLKVDMRKRFIYILS